MLVTILSLLALLSAALHIIAHYRNKPLGVYICKPFMMVFLIIMVMADSDPPSSFYQRAILVGFLFSLAGDIFLMLPSDRFIHGLISFLIAHLCYIAAFTASGARTPLYWTLLPFIIYGAILLWQLLPGAEDMKVPVVIYALVLLVMGWQACNRWLIASPPGALLAFIGAIFFMLSDSLLALDRFKRPFRSAQGLLLATYAIAQLLIALSV